MGERQKRLKTWLKRTEVESSTQGLRPRTQKKSEAKNSPSEDKSFRGQGHKSSEKIIIIMYSKIFFRRFKKNKKVFQKVLQVIPKKQSLKTNFLGNLQNFNNLKNSAVLEPRTGQFEDLRLRGQGLQNVSSRTLPL